MIFTCDGCQTERDHIDLKRCVITADHVSKFLRFCRFCIAGTVTVPDVFWKPGFEEHGLADGPDGKPRVFGSKAEKAAYLKERGLQEAGDRVRGSFPTVEEAPKRDGREEVRSALREVARISPDYRHQEYLRITKGRGR